MVLSTSLISAPERPRERTSRWPDRFHTLLSEYSDDIYLYLRQLEVRIFFSATFICFAGLICVDCE